MEEQEKELEQEEGKRTNWRMKAINLISSGQLSNSQLKRICEGGKGKDYSDTKKLYILDFLIDSFIEYSKDLDDVQYDYYTHKLQEARENMKLKAKLKEKNKEINKEN